ncbi:hypothetical protein ACFX2A_044784 [Malus domestica]
MVQIMQVMIPVTMLTYMYQQLTCRMVLVCGGRQRASDSPEWDRLGVSGTKYILSCCSWSMADRIKRPICRTQEFLHM